MVCYIFIIIIKKKRQEDEEEHACTIFCVCNNKIWVQRSLFGRSRRLTRRSQWESVLCVCVFILVLFFLLHTFLHIFLALLSSVPVSYVQRSSHFLLFSISLALIVFVFILCISNSLTLKNRFFVLFLNQFDFTMFFCFSFTWNFI